MNISECLSQMRSFVLHDKDGDLPLAWRLRLWSLMKETCGREEFLSIEDYRGVPHTVAPGAFANGG